MPARKDRLEGGMLGLLVGDALGVPYEFNPPEQLPALASLEFDPPRGFARSHAGVPPGTYSDDGAHALILLTSLLHANRLDLDDLGRRLVNWRELGYMAVEYEVFDIGIQTSIAISNYKAGAPAEQAGYVVDCLRSARCATEAGGFEEVVKAAVALGNDTDTTAAVAGGFAGVRDGVGSIPARWRTRLRGADQYGPVIAKLLAGA